MRDGLGNILAHAARPGFARVMAQKLLRRMEPDESVAAAAWAKDRADDFRRWAAGIDAAALHRAEEFAEALQADAADRLAASTVRLGGGGHVALLHFITSTRKPDIALETGVAAGFSSNTILTAMEENRKGRLFSSDFPYFRQSNAEQAIGLMVPQELRDRWVLDIRGDARALPDFAHETGRKSIGLFHYDSDKSRAGRAFALNIIAPCLADGAAVIFDDIQDNLFFRDLVETTGLEARIFETNGKFAGIIPHWNADQAASILPAR